ncbi:Hsp70 family protein [Dactylosporangium siamense]|uniref:Hsp70 family protein n=1 Tax=Dactylosporangium siamense TaxID=685454 RepID=UPI001944BEB3|nr:Hsp70 family protein [Dactylosporangium siamense]
MTRLGIDFGTSTTVAVLAADGREPRPLLFDGSPLMPSAVCLDADGGLVVGRDAVHLGMASPGRLEPNPKRRVDEAVVLLGDAEVPVGRLFKAVLDRAVAEAAGMSGGALTGVVVTCPAAWGQRRRQVLLDAAPPGTRLVAEPVAAAHYFADVAGHRVPVGGTALVYDFGAGTFDASVVRRTEDGFELLATLGLDAAGGLDVDAALLAHLRDLVPDSQGYWPRLTNPADALDRRVAQQVWDNVRTAKEMLSRLPSTLVHLPLFNVEVPLDRATLDRLAAPVLQRTVSTCVEVLAVAGQPMSSLAAVFLAGGSSRMPAVAAALEPALGVAPVVVDQPELAVAEGSLRGFDQPTPGAAAPISASPQSPSPATFPAPARPALAAPPTPPALATPQPLPQPSWRGRRGLVVLAAVVALVVLAGGGALAWSLRPDPRADALPAILPTPSASASPSPSVSPSPVVSVAAGLDPCLVGKWRQTSSEIHVNNGSKREQFSGGAGILQEFDGEGHMVYDTNASAPYRATFDGATWDQTFRGVARGNYRILDGAVVLSGQSGEISWVINRNGKRNNSGKGPLSTKPERYLCDAQKLIQYGPDGDYTNELERIP